MNLKINTLDFPTGQAAAAVPFWDLLAVTSNMYLLPCFRLKGLRLSKADEIPGNPVLFMLLTLEMGLDIEGKEVNITPVEV